MIKIQVFRSLLALAFGIHHVCIASSVDIAFDNHTDVYVTEGEQVEVNVTMVAYNGPESTMTFQSANEDAFEIINASSYIVSNGTVLPQVYHVTIRGINYRVSSMEIMVAGVGSSEKTRVGEIPIKILRPINYFFLNILNYIFFIPISVTYFLMGYTIDMTMVWKNLKRPFAVFIGFACQFVAMPALAFGIGKVMQLEPLSAIGLLLVGCCPGGKLSNDLCVLVDADFTLSVTMTTCSTILALATMPLNIFIYTPLITDSSLETPYDQMAIQLVAMLFPVLAGILARYRWPHYEKKVLKIFKPVVAVIMIVVICASIPFQLYIFFSPWQIYVSSLILPCLGAILGAIFAKLGRLKNNQVAAIAFETGVQNAIIAYVILSNAYPQPEADLAGRVTFITMMLQFFLGMAVFGTYTFLKRFVFEEDEEPEKDKEELANDISKDGSINTGIYRPTTLDSPVPKEDEDDETQGPARQSSDINFAFGDTEL
ncbi:ileal sodium/bile acid cotransporter-like [Lytechinus pictus]|uniref:ileal sodium/bile acid cotransporter-like n=1 Tax=Lytechinus pictus TaxID=7653 RepID=UPI0030BA24AD